MSLCGRCVGSSLRMAEANTGAGDSKENYLVKRSDFLDGNLVARWLSKFRGSLGTTRNAKSLPNIDT